MNKDEVSDTTTQPQAPKKEPINMDRVSVNEGPFFQPKNITNNLEVLFNGVKQSQVVEFCISEGWVQRYKRDWKGRPVMRSGDYVLGPKLKGTVDVYWKV